MIRSTVSSQARTRYISLAAAVAFGTCLAKAGPFYMGADVSLIPFMQQQGVAFKQSGNTGPADEILYDAGANLFRLRIFVNPQTTYTNTNVGAIQTQAYDIALAQQLKADDPGAKLLLDFHYSDTWADPGSQTLPAAWATPAQTLTQLESTVQSYTDNTLLSFKSAGVMPDMVQVGNEINNGMDFPTGQVNYNGSTSTQKASWAAFGGLVKSAIAGVRQAQGTGPAVQVAIHIANGDQGDGTATGGEPYYFFQKLSDPNYGNVSTSLYDIMGVSFYPTATTGMSTLKTNLDELADVYNKSIMVLETDTPWESTSVASDPAYPDTSAGQLQFLTDLKSTVQNLDHGDGLGLLYWYPESVQIPGYNIYNGGATALFDTSYNALPALSAFNTTGLVAATWAKTVGADWNTASDWLGARVPNGAGAEADLMGALTSAQTISNNTSVTLGSLYFNNSHSYTLSGTGSLTIQTVSGNGLIDVMAGSHVINVPLIIASTTALNVSGGSTLTLNNPVTVNSGTSLYPAGAGTVNYNSSITLQTAAIISFGNSFHSTGLFLTGTSAAYVASHGSNSTFLVQLDQLSFGGASGNWQGTLDLFNNDMVVHGGSVGNVTSQIAQGYNSGNWNGSGGILSAEAAANVSHLTALGVILNTADGTTPLYGSGASLGLFDNTSPGLNDVLVRHTYYGDANLDGIVDGSDYSRIDSGFITNATGWYSGDFNYDGIINGSDYTLIDNAFNSQGAPFTPAAAITDEIGATSTTSAVPEPGVVIPGILISLILRRRQVISD